MTERNPGTGDKESGKQDENEIPKARFDMGEAYVTPEAHFSLQVRGIHPFQLFTRHVEGDWGNVHPNDAEENEQSADLGGGRILSIYDIDGDARFYVRTVTTDEGNVTTIYLPHED